MGRMETDNSTTAAEPEGTVPTARHRPRVLLAEDTDTARALTARLLERMGCDVDAVEHGEQALKLARDVRYDAIFLDLDMPLLDGMAAAQAIRSLPANEASQIIAISAFLTGIADSADRWRVFDGEIPKPISLDRLRQVIHDVWPVPSGGAARGTDAELGGQTPSVDTSG